MFITEPTEFASFRDELIFEYSQDDSSDLTFEIELEGEESTLEVKKLYDVSNATINLAPIIANKFMTTPSSGVSALETPQDGYGLVTLRCGDDSSSTKYFVAARNTLPDTGVISTMPTSRFISYSEAEEIWIRAEKDSEVSVCVETTDEGGTIYHTFDHTIEECGFARFRFNTTDFSAYTKIAKVTFACDGEVLTRIQYLYISRPKGSVRLAWVGSYGGVEHYTFPATNTLSLLKNGNLQYQIESAYEPFSVVEALSDILIAESVWLVEEGKYVEVELLSDSLILNKNGELSTVEYKIERYD